MNSYYGIIIIGFIFIVIGMFNMKGNISSLHWYHRKRVMEKDIIPFGKKIGLGMIMIGCSAILFGIFSIMSELFNQEIFSMIGTIVFSIGIIIGLMFNFYAMLKYNKGIF